MQNWFILKRDSHLGPYSEEDLADLYKTGQLKKTDFIWKEGIDDPISYEEFLDQPPAIPLSLIKAEKKSTNVGEKLEVQVDNHLSDKSYQVDENYQDDEIQSFEEIQGEFSKTKLSGLKIVSLILILAAMIIPSLLYYHAKNPSFDKPVDITQADMTLLKEALFDRSRKVSFRFALNKDKSKIYVTSNIPLEGRVYIKLKSQNSRVLGKPIELKSSGFLENHLITFSQLDFLQGTQIIDGYYDVELYTTKDLKRPLSKYFSRPFEPQFQYLDTVFLSNMDKKTFEKRLNQLVTKKLKNALNFRMEIIEKYRTVMAMTQSIKEEFSQTLSLSGKSLLDRINMFESAYTNKFGVFFTEFVKENEASYVPLYKKKFPNKGEILAEFSNLSKLAKQIGHTSMFVMESIRKEAQAGIEAESRFDIKNYEKEFDKILKDGELKIQILTNSND